MVVKPVELTPLNTLKVTEMLKEASFPPGIVSILPGYGPSAGAALYNHMKVRKIAFSIKRSCWIDFEGFNRVQFKTGATRACW
jgi:delta 1-pyrroline-5-carboxylate dehydrogenase